MQLVVYFSRLCFPLHKRQDFLQLLLVACLKPRRIVENKPGVALECERPMDIVYPSLIWVGSDILVDIYSKWSTAEVGSSWLNMSEAEFIFRSMITHQVLMVLVVDTRILGCVADSLQERRFSSISLTDYKDTKASIFGSEVIGITVVHDR